MSFLSERFPADLTAVRSLSGMYKIYSYFSRLLKKIMKRINIHVQIHFILISVANICMLKSVYESMYEILDELSE